MSSDRDLVADPLQNSDGGHAHAGEHAANRRNSAADAVECTPSSWNWKKLLLITSLWWSYLLINGGHSMMSPFFPNEVRIIHACTACVSETAVFLYPNSNTPSADKTMR